MHYCTYYSKKFIGPILIYILFVLVQLLSLHLSL